jgi:hypothetical protein
MEQENVPPICGFAALAHHGGSLRQPIWMQSVVSRHAGLATFVDFGHLQLRA